MIRAIPVNALLLVIVLAAIPRAHASGRAFTVADAVQLPRLVAPNLPGRSMEGAAVYSPQRRSALVTVTHGDLARNVNVHELLLFRAAELEEFHRARGKRAAPSPSVVARVEDSGSAAEMLANLKWIGEEEVAFTARDRNGIRQVVVVDVRSHDMRQVTQSATDVTSFDISGGALLYYAKAPAVSAASISIDRQNLQQLLTPDNPYLVELWFSATSGGTATRVDLPVMFLLDYFQRVWLAPDGKRAIVFVPATQAPTHWARYRVPQYEVYGYTADRRRADYDSQDLALRTRYALIDLERNEVRPLMDAPSGHLSLNQSPVAVFWDTKAGSVIVSNAFLPLQSSPEDEARAVSPAIVEVDLASGDARRIIFEPHRIMPANRLSAPAIRSLDWNEKDQRLSLTREGSPDTAEIYQKSGAQWRKSTSRRATQDDGLTIRQGMNERPRLFIGGELLFDPAPGADAYTFGRAEVVHWRDGNGIEWRGSLTYPPQFTRDRRYPLVMQTHGFDETEFLIDGPGGITTAMAAQPLANAGLLVLQVEDNAQAAATPERAAAQYAEGYRAGVAALVERGIVDARKVGIIAFSSTGLPIIRLLADQPDLFAAADVSDASWWGYFQELTLTNAVPDLAIQYLRRTSASLQREPADLFKVDPLYRLPATRAAIRLEANGANALVSTWEHYAVLRKASHPVEFMYHPEGSHVLTRPSERLASQGGAVDWFRFWLDDSEDPDPSKAAQYEKWRALRVDRWATHSGSSASPSHPANATSSR